MFINEIAEELEGGKRVKNKLKSLSVVISGALLALFVSAQNAFAITGAFNKAGVTGTGKIDGLYEDLKGVVNIIITVGAFWAIAWLIIAGMTLSSSGGNPQKRSAGIVALGMVLVGIFVIYKAYDIAGWATGIG